VPVTNTIPPANIKLIQETVTDSFDGGTDTFTLTHNVQDKNIFVYFNGVLQEPEAYTYSGNILHLAATIPVGWKVDVVYSIDR
jgi:hypothetical protein